MPCVSYDDNTPKISAIDGRVVDIGNLSAIPGIIFECRQDCIL